MSISKAEHDELCCVYAGLLLHDDNSEITAEKINKIIEASGNKVDSYYPEFFANFLKTADFNALLNASSSAPAGAAPAEEAKKEDKKDDKKKDDKKKKEKPKEEEEEEDGMDLGGLF